MLDLGSTGDRRSLKETGGVGGKGRKEEKKKMLRGEVTCIKVEQGKEQYKVGRKTRFRSIWEHGITWNLLLPLELEVFRLHLFIFLLL